MPSSTAPAVSQATINEIDSLARVLTAIANLSPASIWQQPPASGGSDA